MDPTSIYVIEVSGCVPSALAGELTEFTRHQGQDTTILTGPVADSAALYGLLARLESVGVPLISARPLTDAAEKR